MLMSLRRGRAGHSLVFTFSSGNEMRRVDSPPVRHSRLQRTEASTCRNCSFPPSQDCDECALCVKDVMTGES